MTPEEIISQYREVATTVVGPVRKLEEPARIPVRPRPQITKVEPLVGGVGDEVRITGVELGGNPKIFFGAKQTATPSPNADGFTTTVPAGLALGDKVKVVVSTSLGTAVGAVLFTVAEKSRNESTSSAATTKEA
ncbi:IPT/TIG domain-containing protein [Amycolatopsis sp. NPDC051045]|uniref:IPT/TIG domain-containing protein n=1 Tax=Amycolatopsis sp. NPDC051045 TaxID=3156922 RepID=UPI0034309AFC